ncbi:MAG: hypothetical protein AB7Y46_09125 [Armatimonadota bacterium]
MAARAPMLLLTAPEEGARFDAYLDEVLRSEGWCLHEHRRAEAGMTAGELAQFGLVLVSHGAAQVLAPEAVEQYLEGGGRVIAVKPPREWGPLFGLTARTSETYATVRDAYLRIAAEHSWLTGFPALDLQLPGEVHVYEPGSARPLGLIAGQRGQATEFPAVAVARRGRGLGVLFAFDLGACIVALHQGRPGNASNGPDPDANRDGKFTADDLFEGMRDFSLRHVPQADVLQDLLTRIILGLTAESLPLPRLWHFPNAAPALLLLDGDGDGMSREDLHATLGVCERHGAHFGFFLMQQQIDDFNPVEVNAVRARGHSFGPHPWTSLRPTIDQWRAEIEGICARFRSRFGFAAESLRSHSVIFPGWDESPRIFADAGLRLDTSFMQGYRYQSGYLNGSALPARFVDREGRVLDCWEQSTILGDDTLVTTKVMLPPKTEQECIDLSREAMEELARRYHGVFHPYFHPINVGGHGRVHTARWLEAVLAEGARLGMPAPSPDQWLHFTQARRAARIHGVSWDRGRRELHFGLLAAEGAQSLTILLPPCAGVGPEHILLDGEVVDGRSVSHEGLGWTALMLDVAAGQRRVITARYPTA